MRIAALVLGLFIGSIAFFQSCTLGVAGELARHESMQMEAGAGILIALMAVVGAAFVIGKPGVAKWLFAIAAVVGIVVGAQAEIFQDLLVWGILLVIPAVASFLDDPGRRGSGPLRTSIRDWVGLSLLIALVVIVSLAGRPTRMNDSVPLTIATSTPAAATPAPTPTEQPQTLPPITVASADENLVLWNLAVVTAPLLDYRVVIGVVKNEGNGILPGVSLEFRFRNQERRLEVATHSTNTFPFGEIRPGESAWFYTTFLEPSGDQEWDLLEVSVKVNPIGSVFGKSVPGLEVADIEVRRQGILGASLVGTLKNHGDQRIGGTGVLEGFRVAVAGYDSQGQLVVVGETSVSRVLEPGWSAQFQANILFGKAEEAVAFFGRALVIPAM